MEPVPDPPQGARLTPLQERIVRLRRLGMTQRQISEAIGVARSTISCTLKALRR